MSSIGKAVSDIQAGFQRYELWLTLGWRDVLSRYRRSVLGSFWITLSLAIVAVVMGSLYSAIMQRPASDYVPYLTVGFIVWNMLLGLITEGTQAFVSNAAALKEIPVPSSIYIFRIIWRNIIIFAHNLVVYVLLMLVFQKFPFPSILLALPALVLILLNGIWIGVLFGVVNARYRDFGQIINNSMRLVFFITPIIWYAEQAVGLRGVFVYFNPFYYFVEILRAPMLGLMPTAQVWFVAITITVIGWSIALPIYARWRRQIAYWV